MIDRAAPADGPGLPGRPPVSPGRRLGVPSDGPSWLLVLLLVLSAASLGAALAGRVAWPPTTLPPDAVAITVASAAVPGAEVRVTARTAAPFDFEPALRGADRLLVPVLGGDDYRFGRVALTIGPVDDPAGAFEQAGELLARVGWTVGAVRADEYGRRLTARRGDLVMALAIDTRVGDDGLIAGEYEPLVTVWVAARPPASMALPVLGGWLGGAAVGWLLGTVLTRRIAGRPNRVALSVGGLLLATPLALAGTFVAGMYVFGGRTDGPDAVAPWLPYMLWYLRVPALLGLALTIGAAVRRPGR